MERTLPDRREVEKPQFIGSVTDLILPEPARAPPRPQAFLVEQRANWTLPTHFHQEHQFQVFVAGDGRIGRNTIGRLAVHYASPHAAYGPLIAGDEGISYLTLRAVGDTGAWYLPEQRAQLQLGIKKQQAHGAPGALMDADELRELPQPVTETLIAPEAGGLAAWLLRLPSGASVPAPARADEGGGRFYVVTEGSLLAQGEEMSGLASIFVSSDDDLGLQAGDQGLEVLVLQFPAEAAQSFVEKLAVAPS